MFPLPKHVIHKIDVILRHFLWTGSSDINSKSDSLWVKWVHNYYIKGDSLMDMNDKVSYLWIMRSILKQRESVVQLQTIWKQIVQGNKFSTKKVYLKMRSIGEDKVN